MDELRRIDQVAYVRFASVYRQFRDVGEFTREIDELQKSKASDPSARIRCRSRAVLPADGRRRRSGGRFATIRG